MKVFEAYYYLLLIFNQIFCVTAEWYLELMMQLLNNKFCVHM